MRRAITSQPVHQVEDYERDLASWRDGEPSTHAPSLFAFLAVIMALGAFALAFIVGSVYAWFFFVG